MATEKRLIEIIECLRNCANNTDCERCSRWLHPCDEKCVDDLMASAAEELERFANAVEVVHGRWVGYHEADIGYDEYGVRCSSCNFEVEDHEVDFIMNYCPNCGAKMEGDGNG